MVYRLPNTWRGSVAKTEPLRVLLDSSAFIAVMKGEPSATRIDGLLGMIDRGEAELVESVLVLTEIYKRSTVANKKERQRQDARLAQILAKLESPDVTLVDVTVPSARRATDYRHEHKLKTADAAHLATAVLNKCDWFVTLDRDFPELEDVKVFCLQALDSSIPVPWDVPVQDPLFPMTDNVVAFPPAPTTTDSVTD